MLTRVFQSSPRFMSNPIRSAMIQTRQYTDKFSEREAAAENQYMRKRQEEQIKQLQEELEKAKKLNEELKGKINSNEKKKEQHT
ncbi:hypothetical protein GGI07_002691 [Coemansia sp. Benny D115]|nr:hypothetical protein GGI07_002691 [Coemansia sp. Benny D115]